jgi:hypothetical protein
MVLLFQTPLGLPAAYCWARVPTAEHGPPESFLAYVQPSETRRKLAFSDCLPNPSSSHLWSLGCPLEHLNIRWAKTEYSASPDPARRYKLKFQTGNAGCRILKQLELLASLNARGEWHIRHNLSSSPSVLSQSVSATESSIDYCLLMLLVFSSRSITARLRSFVVS